MNDWKFEIISINRSLIHINTLESIFCPSAFSHNVSFVSSKDLFWVLTLVKSQVMRGISKGEFIKTFEIRHVLFWVKFSSGFSRKNRNLPFSQKSNIPFY